MAFKSELCAAWVAERSEPGEQFVSHVVAATRTPTNPAPVGRERDGLRFTGTEALRAVAERLGLRDDDKVGFMVTETFLALTDRRVFYGSRSGFRNRPKDQLHVAPGADFSVHWIDDDIGAGNRFRHLLLDFGGGAWRTDRIGLSALGKDLSASSNVHHFFDALGERAREIDV